VKSYLYIAHGDTGPELAGTFRLRIVAWLVGNWRARKLDRARVYIASEPLW
jgi:hypothetical protein